MTGSVQKPENFTAVAIGQAGAKMAKKHRHTGSYILRGLVWLSGALVAAFFLLLVGFILVKGIPNLKPSLFSLESTVKTSPCCPPSSTRSRSSR